MIEDIPPMNDVASYILREQYIKRIPGLTEQEFMKFTTNLFFRPTKPTREGALLTRSIHMWLAKLEGAGGKGKQLLPVGVQIQGQLAREFNTQSQPPIILERDYPGATLEQATNVFQAQALALFRTEMRSSSIGPDMNALIESKPITTLNSEKEGKDQSFVARQQSMRSRYGNTVLPVLDALLNSNEVVLFDSIRGRYEETESKIQISLSNRATGLGMKSPSGNEQVKLIALKLKGATIHKALEGALMLSVKMEKELQALCFVCSRGNHAVLYVGGGPVGTFSKNELYDYLARNGNQVGAGATNSKVPYKDIDMPLYEVVVDKESFTQRADEIFLLPMSLDIEPARPKTSTTKAFEGSNDVYEQSGRVLLPVFDAGSFDPGYDDHPMVVQYRRDMHMPAVIGYLRALGLAEHEMLEYRKTILRDHEPQVEGLETVWKEARNENAKVKEASSEDFLTAKQVFSVPFGQECTLSYMPNNSILMVKEGKGFENTIINREFEFFCKAMGVNYGTAVKGVLTPRDTKDFETVDRIVELDELPEDEFSIISMFADMEVRIFGGALGAELDEKLMAMAMPSVKICRNQSATFAEETGRASDLAYVEMISDELESGYASRLLLIQDSGPLNFYGQQTIDAAVIAFDIEGKNPRNGIIGKVVLALSSIESIRIGKTSKRAELYTPVGVTSAFKGFSLDAKKKVFEHLMEHATHPGYEDGFMMVDPVQAGMVVNVEFKGIMKQEEQPVFRHFTEMREYRESYLEKPLWHTKGMGSFESTEANIERAKNMPVRPPESVPYNTYLTEIGKRKMPLLKNPVVTSLGDTIDQLQDYFIETKQKYKVRSTRKTPLTLPVPIEQLKKNGPEPVIGEFDRSGPVQVSDLLDLSMNPPKGNWSSHRQKNPWDFQQGTLRTFVMDDPEDNRKARHMDGWNKRYEGLDGVHVIAGKLAENGKWHVQTIRVPRKHKMRRLRREIKLEESKPPKWYSDRKGKPQGDNKSRFKRPDLVDVANTTATAAELLTWVLPLANPHEEDHMNNWTYDGYISPIGALQPPYIANRVTRKGLPVELEIYDDMHNITMLREHFKTEQEAMDFLADLAESVHYKRVPDLEDKNLGHLSHEMKDGYEWTYRVTYSIKETPWFNKNPPKENPIIPHDYIKAMDRGWTGYPWWAIAPTIAPHELRGNPPDNITIAHSKQSKEEVWDDEWIMHRINAYIGNENVGYLKYIIPDDEPLIFVNALWVDENQRDKGIGKLLLDELRGLPQAKGKEIKLRVTKYRRGQPNWVKEWYERIGFVETAWMADHPVYTEMVLQNPPPWFKKTDNTVSPPEGVPLFVARPESGLAFIEPPSTVYESYASAQFDANIDTSLLLGSERQYDPAAIREPRWFVYEVVPGKATFTESMRIESGPYATRGRIYATQDTLQVVREIPAEWPPSYYAPPSSNPPKKTPGGKTIPKRYLKGLTKEEMQIAIKEIDKGYEYDIDDPEAYEYWKSDIKATARGYKTVPSKYKKKFIELYGPLPEKGKFIEKMAKATGIKKSILQKVYDKGLAAWRTGHRPGVKQHQWAAGRVYSFVTLGNTVKKGKKKMSDYQLAIDAGLIKENPVLPEKKFGSWGKTAYSFDPSSTSDAKWYSDAQANHDKIKKAMKEHEATITRYMRENYRPRWNYNEKPFKDDAERKTFKEAQVYANTPEDEGGAGTPARVCPPGCIVCWREDAKPKQNPSKPSIPKVLYHGTSSKVAEIFLKEGKNEHKEQGNKAEHYGALKPEQAYNYALGQTAMDMNYIGNWDGDTPKEIYHPVVLQFNVEGLSVIEDSQERNFTYDWNAGKEFVVMENISPDRISVYKRYPPLAKHGWEDYEKAKIPQDKLAKLNPPGVPKPGKELTPAKKREIRKKWLELVNMTKTELQTFYDSDWGNKKAGLSRDEAKEQGISSGRDSALAILKMKETSPKEWSRKKSKDRGRGIMLDYWQWAQKQINFNTRHRAMRGAYLDDKGRPKRKLLGLWIWGHDPWRYARKVSGESMLEAPDFPWVGRAEKKKYGVRPKLAKARKKKQRGSDKVCPHPNKVPYGSEAAARRGMQESHPREKWQFMSVYPCPGTYDYRGNYMGEHYHFGHSYRINPLVLKPLYGDILAVSGPSGSGKSTMAQGLMKKLKGVKVPSYMTREKRPSEKVGIDGVFISKEEFEKMIADGIFTTEQGVDLWVQQKSGEYYGRRASDFLTSKPIIVDVNFDGLRLLRKAFPNKVYSVFIRTNMGEERRRQKLEKRGVHSEEEIKQRVKAGTGMLNSYQDLNFDFISSNKFGELDKNIAMISKEFRVWRNRVLSNPPKQLRKGTDLIHKPSGQKHTFVSIETEGNKVWFLLKDEEGNVVWVDDPHLQKFYSLYPTAPYYRANPPATNLVWEHRPAVANRLMERPHHTLFGRDETGGGVAVRFYIKDGNSARIESIGLRDQVSMAIDSGVFDGQKLSQEQIIELEDLDDGRSGLQLIDGEWVEDLSYEPNMKGKGYGQAAYLKILDYADEIYSGARSAKATRAWEALWKRQKELGVIVERIPRFMDNGKPIGDGFLMKRAKQNPPGDLPEEIEYPGGHAQYLMDGMLIGSIVTDPVTGKTYSKKRLGKWYLKHPELAARLIEADKKGWKITPNVLIEAIPRANPPEDDDDFDDDEEEEARYIPGFPGVMGPDEVVGYDYDIDEITTEDEARREAYLAAKDPEVIEYFQRTTNERGTTQYMMIRPNWTGMHERSYEVVLLPEIDPSGDLIDVMEPAIVQYDDSGDWRKGLESNPPKARVMLPRIIVMDHYTPALLRSHQNYAFIFGDNEQRKGKGGQAVIRDEPNAFGVRTKKSARAFWNDSHKDSSVKMMSEDFVRAFSAGYDAVVIPRDGIGTGLAQLKQKAPQTWKWLSSVMKELNRIADMEREPR